MSFIGGEAIEARCVVLTVPAPAVAALTDGVAPELSDVRRFAHRWEKKASVSLRIGDVLLLQGPYERIELLNRDADFLLLSEMAWGPRRTGRASLSCGTTRTA
mgnify:CR=1 FL=1